MVVDGGPVHGKISEAVRPRIVLGSQTVRSTLAEDVSSFWRSTMSRPLLSRRYVLKHLSKNAFQLSFISSLQSVHDALLHTFQNVRYSDPLLVWPFASPPQPVFLIGLTEICNDIWVSTEAPKFANETWGCCDPQESRSKNSDLSRMVLDMRFNNGHREYRVWH